MQRFENEEWVEITAAELRKGDRIRVPSLSKEFYAILQYHGGGDFDFVGYADRPERLWKTRRKG